ncbi:MAG: hypothetical protein CV087_19810 [Candidatus Brocadia sp. WS118]|nr:MAG: hypothetical protein CV087_19810 [Candidatus Brocadia sp. WS118]
MQKYQVNQTLKKHGLDRNKYNLIANYVYLQSEINIKGVSKAPRDYMASIKVQISNSQLTLSGIAHESALYSNLLSNCIQESIIEMDIENNEDFLEKRRLLMAEKLKGYYFGL